MNDIFQYYKNQEPATLQDLQEEIKQIKAQIEEIKSFTQNIDVRIDEYLKYSFYPYNLVIVSSVFILNKCPNALKVHSYDQVIHLVELSKLVEKLLQKQQERLLNFYVFRHNMSSYCIKPYMDGFYTSRSFQGYQEHQNWSSNKEVMQVPKLEENQQTLQHLQ